MGTGALGFEFCKAVEGGFGDFVEGVVGQEGLMTCDDDIGKCEETGKDIVGQDI